MTRRLEYLIEERKSHDEYFLFVQFHRDISYKEWLENIYKVKWLNYEI